MNELMKKAEALMKNSEIASLTSIEENGYPRTAPMCSLKTEGIDVVWFSTGTNSHKTKNYLANPKASVSYCLDGNSISLIGDMEVVEDKQIKTSLWVDWFIKHFPLGIDDPNYCILKFKANYIQIYIDDEFEDFKLD